MAAEGLAAVAGEHLVAAEDLADSVLLLPPPPYRRAPTLDAYAYGGGGGPGGGRAYARMRRRPCRASASAGAVRRICLSRHSMASCFPCTIAEVLSLQRFSHTHIIFHSTVNVAAIRKQSCNSEACFVVKYCCGSPDVLTICVWTIALVHHMTDAILRSGCVWLMGVPAGFKLNTELAELLGMISLNAIQIYSTLWFFMGGYLRHIIQGIAFSGIAFGLTAPVSFFMALSTSLFTVKSDYIDLSI